MKSGRTGTGLKVKYIENSPQSVCVCTAIFYSVAGDGPAKLHRLIVSINHRAISSSSTYRSESDGACTQAQSYIASVTLSSFHYDHLYSHKNADKIKYKDRP